ncbi:MAG: MEDS domain-containing protein, partial [Alphaproteobacteria bacterium]
LHQGMGIDELMEFEMRYDQSLARRFPVVSLCQYDARKFPGTVILNVLKYHQDTFRYPLARFLN